MQHPVQETNKALKEWATVLKALESGQQIILFRKGGIIEQHDEFEVESPQFFLFPTYYHHSEDQLQPQYQPWVAETEAARPAGKQIPLGLFATVEKVLLAKNVERLRELTDAFIWTPEYVEKTWGWKPEKPAYILFLRVYKMASPHLIADKPEYGGCVSWIDIESTLPTGQLTPVLPEAEFEAQCRRIEQQLANTVVTA